MEPTRATPRQAWRLLISVVLDIEKNVRTYLGDRSPLERAASFDYCFNYFRAFRDRTATGEIAAPQHLEVSCLDLGYYLASWGMLRASTALHTKNYRFFERVVGVIAVEPPGSWDIDVNDYSGGGLAALFNTRFRLASALTARTVDGARRTPTDTLVTKVMLGVFGSVPAFDTFFCRGFRAVTGERGAFNRKSLNAIGNFYLEDAEAIDAQPITTLDARSGQPTPRRCTRAKIVDMALLIEGGGSLLGRIPFGAIVTASDILDVSAQKTGGQLLLIRRSVTVGAKRLCELGRLWSARIDEHARIALCRRLRLRVPTGRVSGPR